VFDASGDRLFFNTERNGRFHSDWCSMLYSRLLLARNLLASDGVIFISIDKNEAANLEKICDEIFGRSNFIANIAVVNNLKGRSDDKYIATAHEQMLIYHSGTFETRGVDVPDEYVQEYKLMDANGKYRLQGLRKRGAGARREDRPNMFYPFYYTPQKDEVSLKPLSDDSVEILPKLSDGSDGRWRWGKDTATERLNELTAQLVQGRNEYDIFQKE
jgi:adenine-specific DNA-methyltransferase